MWLRYGSLVFALPGVLLIALYGFELGAVTDCQQQGLFYDVSSGECVSEEQPLTSYYQRNTTFVNLMLLASTLGALAMTWGMLLRGMTRPNPED